MLHTENTNSESQNFMKKKVDEKMSPKDTHVNLLFFGFYIRLFKENERKNV